MLYSETERDMYFARSAFSLDLGLYGLIRGTLPPFETSKEFTEDLLILTCIPMGIHCVFNC